MVVRTLSRKCGSKPPVDALASKQSNPKAIATLNILVNLPQFTWKDLSEYRGSFRRFLRMTGQTHADGRVKCNLLLHSCKTKYLEKQVKHIVTKSATFTDLLVALERRYPSYETNLSILTESQILAMLPDNPKLRVSLKYWPP